MDQHIVGKINGHNKTKFIAPAVLCILLVVSSVYASDAQSEFELFDRGYKDYLSYHPGEAAEEFRRFLKEFPRSSARDAVLFWLGKSLEQLKSVEEAKKIFGDIKQQYPDSPFVRYADKEIQIMTRMSGFAGTEPGKGSETKIAGSVTVKAAEAGDQAGIQQKEIQKARELKKESKSTEPKKEISKKPEVPVQPAVSAVKGSTSSPAAALEQKAIYSVQVGVFKIQSKANDLGAELKREGYAITVAKGTLHGEDVFKVLVGKLAGKDEADAVAAKLKRVNRLDAIVTTSESEEVQIAQLERPGEAGERGGAESLAGREEKSANVPAVESGKIKVGEGSKPLPGKLGEGALKKEEPLALHGKSADRVETSRFPAMPRGAVIYSVQVGVFHQQKTTDKLRFEFEKQGYPVKIIKGSSKGRDVFKVLVGQFADKNEAKSLARVFEKKYGENTIVSMSEAGGEMPAGRVEFMEAAEGTKKPGPASPPAEKETVKAAATATHTESKDIKPQDVRVQAKTQSQLTKEEMNEHVVASVNEKEHVNAIAESSKDEKKQAGAGPIIKKKEDVTAVVAQAVNKESEPKLAAPPKAPEQANSSDKAGKNAAVLKTENKLSSAPVQPTGAEKQKVAEAVEKLPSSSPPPKEKEIRAEFVKKKDEEEKIKDHAMQGPPPSIVEIKELKYTTRDMPAYLAASRSLCGKLHIKEVLWRTGNDSEDFLSEQALYSEAKNLHITVDKHKLTEMIENYQLNDREADYLQRYLAISGLIERKIKDMPEEKVVESITVRYGDRDRYTKIVLGSDLQNLARKGTPFDEIYRLHPDIMRFAVTDFSELDKRIKEKVQSLRNNEIAVTWSEDGYMILKPVFKGPLFTPFGDMSPGLRDRIRKYVLAWTKVLREKYSAESGREKK
jgi:cell division septation protein DedD